MEMKCVVQAFEALLDKPCWGLHYDRALNLSMNFGNPSLEIREPCSTNSKSDAVRQLAAVRRVTIRGEWWLWIFGCYWRLSSNGVQVATGASSLRRIEHGIAQLEGQELVSVEVNPETGRTRFCFDLGGELECRRFGSNADDELWTLYLPNGSVLAVRGNGQCGLDEA